MSSLLNRRRRPPRESSNQSGSKFFGSLGFWTILALVVLVVAYVQILAASRPQVTGERLQFSTFLDLAERDRIENARILDIDSYIVGEYHTRDGGLGEYNTPYLRTQNTRERLVDSLLENRIPVTIDQQFLKSLVAPASLVLPALIIVTVFTYFILSWRRGTGLFGIRSGARKLIGSERTETFDDVAGQREAVQELSELVGFMSNPERFTEVGARTPKGVLLYGPPGCGKTLMARAFAGEAGATFYTITGSDFVELYVGVGAARVRDLFRQARANAPAIIFIDELDAVGRSRSGDSDGIVTSAGEQEQALNQILAEMDGFSSADGIMVLAATNRPDVLDPALLRPGRFDRSIGLERPDEDDRLAILSLHAKSRTLDPSVDMREVAKRAYGMTGADLANVVNEAALLAGRERKPAITQPEFEEALKRVLEAPERQRRLSMRTRSIGKRATGLDEQVSFDDVAGVEEAVEELREVKDFLVEPERFINVGAEVPRGILLFGPPGCGKSLLARAVAGEAHGAFFSVSATEFVERFTGAGAGRVRDLFAEAKAVAPSIVFIDEIDAIGARRGGGPDGGTDSAQRDYDQTLNQILAELDGFDPHTGVVVIAATNRPDMLDPALTRPGRFDRSIGIAPPDRDAREKILAVHANRRELEPDVDLGAIAEKAHGMTGADLANVVNEAALRAARARKGALSQTELEEALKRVIEAPERQRRLSARQRSVGKRSSGLEKRVTFEDVAGVDDAIEELAEVSDFLADPERFEQLGARAPRGILLTGPPGVGKTLLARAVAGEANAAFLSASGSDFVEIWVGQGASRVRDLFAEAKAMAPTILFIDEIDSLGSKRSNFGGFGGGREYQQTINQLLVELDGFDARSGVILMGATNRPDILDPALLRPGRFDRQIEITLPDRKGREAILNLYSREKRFADDVDLPGLASVTQGFAGADLENIVNEAALLAGRKRLDAISTEVLDEALDRVMMGVASRRHVPSEEERQATAYHEAGHALVGLALPGVTVPHRVSIVPRGRALGFVLNADEEELGSHSRSRLINHMAMGLAGRVAEKLVFNDVNSSASNDLKRANEVARTMVCKYGMGEATANLIFKGEGWDELDLSNYSEEEKRLIYTEVKRLVDEAEETARQVLTHERQSLDRIAAKLLESETLSADELRELAGYPRESDDSTSNGRDGTTAPAAPAVPRA